MIRTIRCVHALGGGLVYATVVDEHLRLVQVVVPFGNSDGDTLREIIDAALDARRPGLPKQGAHDGS
jgi:hypothetical protein